VGYRGRVGVFEALEVDGEVRSCIGRQVDATPSIKPLGAPA